MFSKKFFKNLLFACCLIVLSTGFVFGQHKRNSRPFDGEIKKENANSIKTDSHSPVYSYDFSKPEFLVSKIHIEHDENGVGKITFQKNGYEEDFTEPIKLSEKTLEKLKTLWTELNFLESDEKYQSTERDYAHLGTMKLKLKLDTKERIEEFNWTENVDAKALADEYRKIGNQFVWMFDINVARENQPLESPKIMKQIDSYLSRDQISDPKQMIPFLQELSEDERVPLITRNHASRLLKKIEKIKEEKN